MELPATLAAEQRTEIAPLDLPLAPGSRLRHAFASRIAALGPPARRALLVAAAHAGASQYAFFAGVTARGALDAAERLAAAISAGDYDRAVTHQGVLRLAAARIPVDLALVAAAQRAAGLAMRGTPVDAKLAPGQKGAGQWIANPANEAALSSGLEQAGYTHAQIAEAVAWMRSDPAYQGQPTTISELLVVMADRVHRTAEGLARHS